MKAIYPWAEMQVGDVREVPSNRRLAAVRSAAYMHCLQRARKGEARPAFKVEAIHNTHFVRIERTA